MKYISKYKENILKNQQINQYYLQLGAAADSNLFCI